MAYHLPERRGEYGSGLSKGVRGSSNSLLREGYNEEIARQTSMLKPSRQSYESSRRGGNNSPYASYRKAIDPRPPSQAPSRPLSIDANEDNPSNFKAAHAIAPLSVTNGAPKGLIHSVSTSLTTKHSMRPFFDHSMQRAASSYLPPREEVLGDYLSVAVSADPNDVKCPPKAEEHLPLVEIPNFEATKRSSRKNGLVKAYAANTNQGLVRNYNEDRVSIILNIMKPASRASEDWPKCSFFGVYDGHGGVACADFLRDNLHQYVIREPSFPSNPKEAILRGFAATEAAFVKKAKESEPVDRSGSCAIVLLIVGETIFVANVGDSRAVVSGDSSRRAFALSKDHKPSEESEAQRIIEAGGKIYQSQLPQNRGASPLSTLKAPITGPHRVLPGRLSVCRTFGDVEAKLPELGGNPRVIIAEPDVRAFKWTPELDFIVLASDGIFDKLTSRAVVDAVEESTKSSKATNVHELCAAGVEGVLKTALTRRTMDNVTVVMVAFKNFKARAFPKPKTAETTTIVNRPLISPRLLPDTPAEGSGVLRSKYDQPCVAELAIQKAKQTLSLLNSSKQRPSSQTREKEKHQDQSPDLEKSRSRQAYNCYMRENDPPAHRSGDFELMRRIHRVGSMRRGYFVNSNENLSNSLSRFRLFDPNFIGDITSPGNGRRQLHER